MKKYIYILLLAISGSIAFSSCTEEEVKPQVEENASGGGGSDTRI
jgi:hypothetical protein